MECSIAANKLRVFAKALQALSKTGDELYFEPDEKKSALFAFRSSHSSDRPPTGCDTIINFNECTVIFRFYCKYGVTKMYSFNYMEAEVVDPRYSKENCMNSFVSKSKLFHSALSNFKGGPEELTFNGLRDKLLVRNYIDADLDPLKAVRTEITLEACEFEEYSVPHDCEITFFFKELKALVSFAELLSLDVAFHFDEGGKPIIMSIDTDPTFDCTFYVATLAVVGTTGDMPTASVTLNDQSQIIENERNQRQHETGIETPRKTATIQSESQVNLPEECDKILPRTPPSKKVRTIFSGLLQDTFYASQAVRQSTVLAEDSDNESTN